MAAKEPMHDTAEASAAAEVERRRDALRRAARRAPLTQAPLTGEALPALPAVTPAAGDSRRRAPAPTTVVETPPSTDGRHVFISYARADAAMAADLRAFLITQGLEVWWDGDIPSGANFHRAIGDALDAAAAVVVVWSPASVASEHVFEEAAEAREQRKLITMHVDGLALDAIPAAFRRRQTYPVGDRARLIEALATLGIACRPT